MLDMVYKLVMEVKKYKSAAVYKLVMEVKKYKSAAVYRLKVA